MMTMKPVTSGAKKFFFDRAGVIRAIDSATRRNLSKGLAYIRRAARSSIKRRKKAVSTPGNPPYAHSTDPVATIKNIQFYYDARARAGVVGPIKLNQVDVLNGFKTQGTVPQVLEFSGTVRIREEKIGDTWFRSDGRSRRRTAQREQRVRTAVYRARPYMAPALKQVQKELPGLWAASVKGTA